MAQIIPIGTITVTALIAEAQRELDTVSYTHLTLPTSDLV